MLENHSNERTLDGKTFFFISLPRHDAQYTSTPWQLAVQFAKTNNVFFCDTPFTFLDLIKNYKSKSIRKRVSAYWRQSAIVKEGVTVIHSPFVLPVNFLPKGKIYDFFSRVNHSWVAKRINRHFRENKIDSILYINSFNFYLHDLSSYLTPQKQIRVYHCIDPMVKGFTLKHGPYLQERAVRNSDINISTAPSLRQNFLNKKIDKSYLVPNAANYHLFSKAQQLTEVHQRVSAIQGKVMGYLGNIERRTDFLLLRRIVEILPEWHLLMAGPYDRQFVPAEFLNHPRIHFPGSFLHEEAPSVVKRFDVAIIPFQCDEVSTGIYPLKLYEYLAAGKPVVTTNFNPDILQGISDVVLVARSPDEFAQSVLLAYATDSEEKIMVRQQLASQHTWDHRANEFREIMARELASKMEARASAKQQPKSLKQRIKNNPRLKQMILWFIFRRKPNGSRVMWYIWLWLIFPKYFRSGVNWGSRLDLTPFNKYKLGKYSRIEQGVVINNGMGDVIIHDEVHTGIGCIIIGPVTLHKHVGLSQYVRILGMHHGSDPLSPHHHQPSSRAPVILEEDAFVGTGTVIMGKKSGEPLILGRYCRIGANSVVTTDIPPYSVAVGNPAKVVRVWDFVNNSWVKPGTVPAQNLSPSGQQKMPGKDVPMETTNP